MLDFPSSSKPVLDSSYVSKPKPMCEFEREPMPISKLEHQHQQEIDSALENVKFGKVYSMKKAVILESMQFQDSNSNPMNEVTISKPSLHSETESQLSNNDQDFPIAIRK